MTPNPEQNKQIDSTPEVTDSNEAKESDVKKLQEVDAKKLGQTLEHTSNLEVKKSESKTSLDAGTQEALSYQKESLTVGKGEEILDVKRTSLVVPESKKYSVNFLNLRDMDSNKTEIPEQYREQILEKIKTLGAFEKIKIVGCTDASPIATPNEIEGNKKSFNEARDAYLAKGGECPAYDQLLQSPQDPQNTILGYMRAMKGVMSLGTLTPDQLKKIEISNALGSSELNPKERGFDVSVDYSKLVETTVWNETYTALYDMYGKLDQNSISWIPDSDSYSLNNLNLKTYDLDPNDPSALYMKVVSKVPQASSPEQEATVKQQISKYLKGMIDARGGEYNNGVWSAKSITKEQYLIIASVRDGLLTKEEFISMNTQKNPSLLENKQLSIGKTLKQFIEENRGNKISFSKLGGGKYTCNIVDANNITNKVAVNKNDYLLFGLYSFAKKS